MNKESNSFEHYELISAYLDGEVTEEERAFVENSSKLLSEVEKLQKITEATSSLSPIDPVLREKHLREAISQLPNNAQVIPFRQRKSIQGGVLLAAVAAAVAFLIIPVFNTSNDTSESGDILATGFTERPNIISEESPIENNQTTERQTSADTDTSASDEIASEPAKNAAETESDPSQTDKSSIESTPLDGDEQDQMQVQEGDSATAEEGAAAALSVEASNEEIAEIFDEVNSLEMFLQSAPGVWELQSELFISPLSTDEMNTFIEASPELSECWSADVFSEILNVTPLHIERILIGGEMALAIITESSEPNNSPVISIYQNHSSCPLLFEGPVFDEINSE